MEIRDVIQMANTNLEYLNGTTEPIEALLERCDVVLAVWQDHSQEDGVDTLILKGERLMRGIIKTGVTKDVNWSAIWVNSAAMAVAVRFVLGEPAMSEA